jgi:hypothetical protein
MANTLRVKSTKASATKFALAFCFVMANYTLSDQAAFAQLGQSDWVSNGGGGNGGLQSQQAQMDSSSDNSFYQTRQSSPDRSAGSSMNALQAQMGGLGQSNWIGGGQQQSQPASNEATWYQPAGTGGDDQSELAGSVQQQAYNQQPQQQQYQQQQPQQQFQQQPQQRPQQYPAPQQQQQMQMQQPMQQMQQMPQQISSSDWQQAGNAGLAFAQQGSDSTPDGIDPKALAQMQNAAKAMGSGKQISGQAQQFLNSGVPQQAPQQMQAGVQQSARFRGGFAVPQKAPRMPMQGGMGSMGNPMGGLSTTVNRALNRSVQSAIYKGVNQGLFRGLSKMRF